MAALPIDVDRAGRTPLAAQIYQAIRRAIETGQLASGARLPSWRDLAAQLGVSRDTVRVAYQRLIDEQSAIGFGPAGARVAERPSPLSTPDWLPERRLCRTSSMTSERCPWHFRWACPLKTLSLQAVVPHPHS